MNKDKKIKWVKKANMWVTVTWEAGKDGKLKQKQVWTVDKPE